MVEREVPLLEDWVTPGLAAKMMGLSKQAVHNLMDSGRFETLCRIAADGARPFYVIRGAEVEQVGQARKKAERDQEVSENSS